MGNKISPEFLKKVNAYEISFPAAYKFFKKIMDSNYDNIEVSTSRNAHLYFIDKSNQIHFMLYLKLSKEHLFITPIYNVEILKNSIDSSSLISEEFYLSCESNHGGCVRYVQNRNKLKALADIRNMKLKLKYPVLVVDSDVSIDFFEDIIKEINRVLQ